MRFLLTATILLLLLAPLAGAAQDDAAWSLETRSLDVQSNPAGFTFTSVRDSALATDTLSGAFDADSVTLTAGLRATQPSPAAVRMDLTWRSLVEYRDVDGDGRYGLSDEAVQSVAVASLPHDASVTPLLGGGSSATITYHFPANDSSPGPVPVGGGLPGAQGALVLTFTILPSPGTAGAASLRPTDIGMGAAVRDFPWKADETALALLVEVRGDAPRLDAGPGNLTAPADGDSWVAQWSTQAARDGNAAAAGWSALAQPPNQATAVLSLPRGQSVSQDGVLSAHHAMTATIVAIPRLPAGSPLAYAAGAAIALVALGIPSLGRLRRPRA